MTSKSVRPPKWASSGPTGCCRRRMHAAAEAEPEGGQERPIPFLLVMNLGRRECGGPRSELGAALQGGLDQIRQGDRGVDDRHHFDRGRDRAEPDRLVEMESPRQPRGGNRDALPRPGGFRPRSELNSVAARCASASRPCPASA